MTTTEATIETPTGTQSAERADLLDSLTKARYFLRYTAKDLTDAQAAQCPTDSELCIGGLIKHVSDTEKGWTKFIVDGPSPEDNWDPSKMAELVVERANDFRMVDGETLQGLLDAYEVVAKRTDEVLATWPDLSDSHPLPIAPWFEPGARWSARRVLLHIATETAQHAGHADIIREALDGSKSMG